MRSEVMHKHIIANEEKIEKIEEELKKHKEEIRKLKSTIGVILKCLFSLKK